MKELLAAIVAAGIVFVVLAIIIKTIVVAIVAAVVIFILVGFVPRMVTGRGGRGARR